MTISEAIAEICRILSGKTKRKRRSSAFTRHCLICSSVILPRHYYYDGGPGHRAHDVCVEAVIRREKKP